MRQYQQLSLIDMRTAPPRHLWKTWHSRAGPITHVVIHHSATPATQSIYSMAHYHVNTKDMPSIQYHYVVTCDGQVCWMNDDGLVVWHGHGSNEWGIGVCLVGDFTHEHPPEVQLRAALGRVQRERLAAPVAFRLARVVRAMQAEARAFQETRKALVARYADEAGQVPAECREELGGELESLLAEEIELDLPRITEAELASIEMTVEEALALAWMIGEDE